jgi:hypothetical protein
VRSFIVVNAILLEERLYYQIGYAFKEKANDIESMFDDIDRKANDIASMFNDIERKANDIGSMFNYIKPS